MKIAGMASPLLQNTIDIQGSQNHAAQRKMVK
jgi:hypothetical protein